MQFSARVEKSVKTVSKSKTVHRSLFHETLCELIHSVLLFACIGNVIWLSFCILFGLLFLFVFVSLVELRENTWIHSHSIGNAQIYYVHICSLFEKNVDISFLANAQIIRWYNQCRCHVSLTNVNYNILECTLIPMHGQIYIIVKRVRSVRVYFSISDLIIARLI